MDSAAGIVLDSARRELDFTARVALDSSVDWELDSSARSELDSPARIALDSSVDWELDSSAGRELDSPAGIALDSLAGWGLDSSHATQTKSILKTQLIHFSQLSCKLFFTDIILRHNFTTLVE